MKCERCSGEGPANLMLVAKAPGVCKALFIHSTCESEADAAEWGRSGVPWLDFQATFDKRETGYRLAKQRAQILLRRARELL